MCEWLLWLALTQREGIQNIQRNLSPNSVAWSPLQKASHWPRAQKERCTRCPAGLCSVFSAYNYHLPWTIPAADLSHIWTVSLHISSWERWSASSEEKKKCYTENTIQQQNCIYIYAHSYVLICVSIILFIFNLYAYRVTHNDFMHVKQFYLYGYILYINISWS